MSNKYDKLVDAINKDEEAAQREPHVFVLSEDDKKVLADTIYEGLSAHFDETFKKNDEKRKKIEEEYEAARSKQGLSTVTEVESWAPEYSHNVQRWLRWMGRQLFDKDEEADSAHECLKTIANVLQLLEGKEPTLKDYLKPKWNRFKRHAKSRKFWYYLGCFYLFLFGDVCLAMYHSRVMEIERKNAIIKYYFRNDKTYQKEYQHIDSLINHYGVYDAYDEILKE